MLFEKWTVITFVQCMYYIVHTVFVRVTNSDQMLVFPCVRISARKKIHRAEIHTKGNTPLKIIRSEFVTRTKSVWIKSVG